MRSWRLSQRIRNREYRHQQMRNGPARLAADTCGGRGSEDAADGAAGVILPKPYYEDADVTLYCGAR